MTAKTCQTERLQDTFSPQNWIGGGGGWQAWALCGVQAHIQPPHILTEKILVKNGRLPAACHKAGAPR